MCVADESIEASGGAPTAATEQPAQLPAASVPDTGAAAREPAAAESAPSLADIARQARNQIADPTGLVPGAPKPPGSPAAGATPAGTPPSSPADVLNRYGVSPEGLPPETQAQLADRLTSIDHTNHSWYGQVEAWGQQIRQQAESAIGQAQALQQRVERIAQDPRFQMALQQAVAPQQTAPPNFETEAEKTLWQRTQALEQLVQQQTAQMGQRVQQLDAWRESQTQAADKGFLREAKSEIGAAHKQLDAEFPELANDANLRRQWHEKAAAMLDLQAARGQDPDIATALREAATLLHYPHAARTGATRALEAAKRAARSSTLREQGGRPAVVARGDESLRTIAEQKAAELQHA